MSPLPPTTGRTDAKVESASAAAAPTVAATPVIIVVTEPSTRSAEPGDPVRQARVKRELAEVRERYVAAHPELPEPIRLAILGEKIVPGMTTETAFVALGAPERVTRSVNSEGTNEQWSFPGRTLYFEKGILLSYTEER